MDASDKLARELNFLFSFAVTGPDGTGNIIAISKELDGHYYVEYADPVRSIKLLEDSQIRINRKKLSDYLVSNRLTWEKLREADSWSESVIEKIKRCEEEQKRKSKKDGKIILNHLMNGHLDMAYKEYKSTFDKPFSMEEMEDLVGKSKHVHQLLTNGRFSEAQDFRNESCKSWWFQQQFDWLMKQRKEEFKEKICLELRKLVFDGFTEIARERYRASYAELFSEREYKELELQSLSLLRFGTNYSRKSLSGLDSDYKFVSARFKFLLSDYLGFKKQIVSELLCGIWKGSGSDFSKFPDQDQIAVCAHPAQNLLVTARAGTGKSTTLYSKAALAIADENLNPNQVLILSFNKELPPQILAGMKQLGINGFENAATFDALASRLVKSDIGSKNRIDNKEFGEIFRQCLAGPGFEEQLVEYFREDYFDFIVQGKHLSEEDRYLALASRELETLDGKQVANNIEKIIGDFLFERNVDYKYKPNKYYNTQPVTAPDSKPYEPLFRFEIVGAMRTGWVIDVETPETAPYMQARDTYWRNKKDDYAAQYRLLVLREKTDSETRTDYEEYLTDTCTKSGISLKRDTQANIKERVLKINKSRNRLMNAFKNFIDRVKKNGWSPQELEVKASASQLSDDKRSAVFYRLAVMVYEQYESWLQANKKMDFADVMRLATQRLENDGANAGYELSGYGQIRMADLRWVMLDEFQDFSPAYQKFVQAMLRANPEIRLVAVGDDWQAINAFMGANVAFMHDFTSAFGNAGATEITTTYRCRPEIVNASNSFMKTHEFPGAGLHSYTQSAGLVAKLYMDKIWLERRPEQQFAQARQEDKKYLPKLPAQRNWYTENELQRARFFKIAVQIILAAAAARQTVLFVARTNKVHDVELEQLKSDIQCVLEDVAQDKEDKGEAAIRALQQDYGGNMKNPAIRFMTVHRSKGLEADWVVMLDVTKGQFPLVHGDVGLSAIFGSTWEDAFEDECRLFYVAMTRARKMLLVLTSSDTNMQSPFIKQAEINSFLRDMDGVTRFLDHAVKLEDAKKEPLSQESFEPQSSFGVRLKQYLDTLSETGVTPAETNQWESIRESVPKSMLELISELEERHTPIPEINYALGNADDVSALLAWPQSKVALLVGEQKDDKNDWRDSGWTVVDDAVTSDALAKQLKTTH